jgi:hydrogenase expression/formation protein HypE
MEALARITASMQRACEGVGVPIVTGDTKVVDRGKGDGVYVNTSGVGIVRADIEIGPDRARPGDRVLLSGAIAAHGIAVLSVREGLEFDAEIESDSAPLDQLVQGLLEAAAPHVHTLRDPTRGGVSSALNEIAQASQVGIRLIEHALVVDEQVQGACEILGLDPLYVANEGTCLAIVAPDAAEFAVDAMRRSPLGTRAAIVGEVTSANPGIVTLRSRIGGERVVDLLSGEQLPRIC